MTAHIDMQMRTDDLSAMLASQAAALEAVRSALDAVAAGAALMADTIRRGAKLHYAAAGSSGLMALADAVELPGTFGIARHQIKVHMAGGVPADGVMPGSTEDNTEDACRDAAPVHAQDTVLLLSASGTTPYVLAFAEAAQAKGAKAICIANVAGSALLQRADIGIVLPTGAEFIEGSTRLGAGTAQKVVLNLMSTRMGILLGHVHDGMMVNLNPDNIKLRKRAAAIVRSIAGVDAETAERALKETNYDTKTASLVASGVELAQAGLLLKEHGGVLSDCLAHAHLLRNARPQNKH